MTGAISVTLNKLAHIYDKHAGDFGLSGPKSKDQLNSLRQALESHVADPNTKLLRGQYRGQDANVYVNSETNNAVITDTGDNVIAGFKLSVQQMDYVNTTGRLN